MWKYFTPCCNFVGERLFASGNAVNFHDWTWRCQQNLNQILEEQEGKENVHCKHEHCIICQSSALKKKKKVMSVIWDKSSITWRLSWGLVLPFSSLAWLGNTQNRLISVNCSVHFNVDHQKESGCTSCWYETSFLADWPWGLCPLSGYIHLPVVNNLCSTYNNRAYCLCKCMHVYFTSLPALHILFNKECKEIGYLAKNGFQWSCEISFLILFWCCLYMLSFLLLMLLFPRISWHFVNIQPSLLLMQKMRRASGAALHCPSPADPLCPLGRMRNPWGRWECKILLVSLCLTEDAVLLLGHAERCLQQAVCWTVSPGVPPSCCGQGYPKCCPSDAARLW